MSGGEAKKYASDYTDSSLFKYSIIYAYTTKH